ncbi:MAG: type II secretion system F family protein [Sedimentibacter sp.]|uniref:type II secretion system F family protein n=1 Tax=Sedimentibacter sp. TaxID=1960295 RepID=UPI0029810036|nr:type II secretion system F family protein [Sedimentibacter sp.]MDW5298699.1 type II secretion system F family protein [Sedimentibacter sp.]
MEKLLIVLLGALTVYLIVYILLSSSGREKVKSRISKYYNENNQDDIQEQFIKERNKEQKNKKLAFKLVSKELTNYIASSGLKLTALEFIYFWIGITIVPMLIIVAFDGNIITAIAVGFIGFIIPPILVNKARKKLSELFSKQLSEGLVIMGNSIKGGFTFLQSMQSIANDMQPPISAEFTKVLREIHYGVNQEIALRHMVERTGSEDLELLVSAVVTSSQVGSNLTEILDTIAATIRERIKIKQEINTLTAQGRISGLLIGILPIAIVLTVMVLNPNYFAGFFESYMGKVLLVLSIVMETMGFLIIKKIINIEM